VDKEGIVTSLLEKNVFKRMVLEKEGPHWYRGMHQHQHQATGAFPQQ
jgi:hypothetical protein